MKTYSYNCVDKSILLPWFKKYYVSLFFKLVPRAMTANFITLISSGTIFFLLYLSYYSESISSVGFAAAIAFCLHAYIVGDHLDGMQAKETKTGSPLGEFMDHYLDVYNGAIVFLSCVIFFKDIPAWAFYLFLWLNVMAFAATMMEELERGELYFGPVGTLEGVMVLIVFFLSWLHPVAREFWQAELYAGYPRYWLVILLAGLGYVGTVFDILFRMKYFPRQFLLFSFCSALLAYTLYRADYGFFQGWWIIVLYSGEYIARVMKSYLCDRKHEYPDMILSIGILMLCGIFLLDLIPAPDLRAGFFAVTFFSGLKVVYAFYSVVSELKMFWYWVNPIPERKTKSA